MGVFEPLVFSFLELIQLIFHPFILVTIAIVTVIFVKNNKEYKDGNYYQVTKHPYRLVRGDTGLYGEYLTYKNLKHLEKNGAKFLFNVYVPKANGETTEIDVLMICSKGVFVFESKNYGGWIFGSESQKNWYQTLPAGRGESHKEKFFNPVIQNRLHIKHLTSFLGEQIPMHSIIVFSNRSTLKNVQISSTDINVIKRNDVASTVSTICNQIIDDQLSENDICEIYNKLYPFTQVDEITKVQHVANIYRKFNSKPVLENKPAYEPQATIDLEETFVVASEKNDIGLADVDETKVIPDNMTSENSLGEEIPKDSQKFQCPWCNGNLVLRTATRGARSGKQFYGCSNYPRCKYIKSVTDK